MKSSPIRCTGLFNSVDGSGQSVLFFNNGKYRYTWKNDKTTIWFCLQPGKLNLKHIKCKKCGKESAPKHSEIFNEKPLLKDYYHPELKFTGNLYERR